MIQIIDNFEHRSKLPNFARDQFDTLEEMKNVRDEDIDEGHISYCISTDKHYKFNASNAIDQSTGKWREFKGEKGDPGKDGQDGTNVSSNLTAFVFKSSETTPSKPVGGSWNSDTNVFTPPTGWYTTDQNMVGTIWMSWAVFQTTGTIQGEWSTPIRITGENGKDGQDGKSIEFIYKVSNRVPNSSDKPSSVNEDGSVPDGWTDHPTGVSESNQYEWMCVRTKTDDLWSDWNGPTVWSKWGANGKDGDGVEYIYKRTTTNLSPDRPTEVSQEDDFVPEGWTDDPTGVNENNMYEWVCVRKYKEGIWSEFSNPALWAKWGEKGEPGKDGNDGTSVNIKGEVASEDQLPESAQPGDAYVVNGNLYVWDGLRWNNIGGIKGPAGRDGRIVYPAGIYDATVTYTATDTKAPYVLYGDTYYVMNVTTSWTGSQNEGKTPADDYEQYGEHATWIPMEKFEAVYAKLLIADNGTLGKFVFNGNYMFSQQGVNSSGSSTNEYENFNPSSPDSGSFSPNFYVNGETGKMVATNASIKGSFEIKTSLVEGDHPGFGFIGNNSSIITLNLDPNETVGKGSYGHVSVAEGWLANVGRTNWSEYTFVNVTGIEDSTVKTVLITGQITGLPRGFVYNGQYYYGVALEKKFNAVKLIKIKVPLTYIEFDGKSKVLPVDELIQVCPMTGENATSLDIQYESGFTARFIKFG